MVTQLEVLAAGPGQLDVYLNKVYAIPLLSPEQEQELAKRWFYDGCVDAAKQLVVAHLRFVVSIAKNYGGYGLAMADLIQEGNLGLMKAVKRFDPNYNVRLAPFAVRWIKSAIHDFVLRNWRIVKIATTKAQRKLFFNLRKAKKRLSWFTDDELRSVADDLGVRPKDVQEMEARLSAHDAELDVEQDGLSLTPNVLQHVSPLDNIMQAQDQQQRHYLLQQGLAVLTAREQQIIKQRWLQENKATLQQLADSLAISLERVRQIEKAALAKLKDLIK